MDVIACFNNLNGCLIGAILALAQGEWARPARRAMSQRPSSSHLAACSPVSAHQPPAEQRWTNAAPFGIYSPGNGDQGPRAALNCRLLLPKKNGPIFLTGAADVKEVGLIGDICSDSLS